ncbi:MAG: aminoacyl-tRNA deacylase [Acidimicrobiales bacterium]|jgi:Cys-tRNA(Pro)/Cys-tRNA(Cys) deacylase|nr:aminoacyl-tRNA deacylase [Acidimicrobiales bacterium]
MTPAISELEDAGFAYELLHYEHDPSVGSYGGEAVSKLGLNGEAVFKTLMSELNTGEFVVCLIPVSSSLNLKAVAKAAGVKKASMADGKVAERRTGYVLGGISPFGQSRRHRTFVEKIALSMDSIYVSAGKRGQEIRIVPAAFSALLDASFVTLTKYD